jgi:hypothetical protein
MYDDGKANVDVQKSDGIYSAVIDFSPAEWDKLMRSVGAKTEKIRVEVEFDITEESGPAPLAHYETGFTKKHLDKDYGKANRSSFKAWATGVINLGEFKPAPPDDPRLICNWCGPAKVRPGDTGKLRCTIENDRPLLDQLRVSLGQGVVVNVRRQEGYPEKGEQPGSMTRRAQDTPPILSRPFMVDYEVKKEAEPGPRALRVQFANTILKHDEALHVSPGR